MRYGLVVLAVSLASAGLARADSASVGETKAPEHSYSLQVFKVEVAPTKSDGRVWDGTTILKDLPDPKGLGPTTLAAAAGKKLAEAGLDATVAPDIYVVVEIGDKRLQTSVKQDTYAATWGSGEQQLTVALHAGEYLKISVFDKDLQENTKDLIGGQLHKLTEDELASGVIELQGFDQVLLLQLTIGRVAAHELLYAPGRYRVTIHGASISPLKPAGVVNAGKSWDVFGGLPDPVGTVSMGKVTIALPKVQDSLAPVWDAATEIDLDESSSISVTLVDKDLSDKSDDPVGTASSEQLLAEAPGPDGMIHLSDHAGIVDLSVKLEPVAKPVSADECRALAAHVIELAEAAGEGSSVERLKSLSPDDLRSCVVKTTRKQLECVMAATEAKGLAQCK